MSRPHRRPARRPEADGSVLQWPGAASKFALFAEVLWVGVLTTAAGLAIVTLPAALAAGTRHLHRFLLGEDNSVRHYFKDFLRALPGGLVVGAVTIVLAVLLGLDILLAQAQVIPGWQFILAVGILGLALTALVLLQSASRWNPERGWRAAVGEGVHGLRHDPGAVALVLAAVVLTVVVTWQLAPLIVPGMGCLVFAVLTVNLRHEAHREH